MSGSGTNLSAGELRDRLTTAQNAIVEVEKERELYRSRWLSCVTPEEAEQLRARLREADAVIAHSMFDEGRVSKDLLRWADEALERYRARLAGNWIKDVFKPLPEDEAKLLREYGP